MGTSQRDSLPGGSNVGRIIEDAIGDGNGKSTNGGSKWGMSPRYQVCLLEGLREIFRDESLENLEQIVYRCLTQAYENVSDEQGKQKSRDSIISSILDQLKAYVRDGLEDRLAELLQKCLGQKIEKDGFIPGEDCERILFILYQDGLLMPALVESAVLAYVHELEVIHFQVCQSIDLGPALNRLYGIEELDDELALQIIGAFNLKLNSFHQKGKYQESAIKAANQALEILLGEPASLPFASAQEIKDFFGNKTLADVLRTYYARYLSSILEYHFSQVAPKHLGPKAGFAWTEGFQQSGGHCDTICTEKAEKLIIALDNVLKQETGKNFDDLDLLTPDQIGTLMASGEDRIKDALFPGSKKIILKRVAAND